MPELNILFEERIEKIILLDVILTHSVARFTFLLLKKESHQALLTDEVRKSLSRRS